MKKILRKFSKLLSRLLLLGLFLAVFPFPAAAESYFIPPEDFRLPEGFTPNYMICTPGGVCPDVPLPWPFSIPGFPVPYNLLFAWGPAGELTATGLIIGLIEIGLWIATFVAVLFLIIGGFRYITAHGNEEQAEAAKKTITHSIIGIVIIILSFVVIRVIANALIRGTGGT